MLQTDVTILKTLLEGDGGFVSGSGLAKDLGMSRVGVWARLEKLRGAGFSFEAVRHRGYRIVSEPDQLNEALVLAYLERKGTQARVIVVPEIDSTNSEAERRLADALETPFAVLAGAQTRGRGRLGRRWHSPPQGNLYMSFAFRPHRSPGRMQAITLRLGLALCRFLNECLKVPARVKWPNDLILNGKKIAGMLTEARVDADRMRDLVFGVGLNVLGKTDDWPQEVASMATTLAAHAPGEIRINQLAAELVRLVIAEYEGYLENPQRPGFTEEWAHYDAILGKTVTATREGKPLQAVARGIDDNGNLLLEDGSGNLKAVNSGEVSIGSGSVLF